MNRAQRRAHRWAWLVLMVAIVGLCVAALLVRGRTETEVMAWAAKAGPR